MIRITLKFTLKEVELLGSLAADQLFRREFIDPTFPGCKTNPAEVTTGKLLVERLRGVSERAKRLPPARRSRAAA
jgi:hypothetical protein